MQTVRRSKGGEREREREETEIRESGLRPGDSQVEDGDPVPSASHLQMGRTERRSRVRRDEPSFLAAFAILDAAQGTRRRVRGVDSLVESGQTPCVSNELGASVAIFRGGTSVTYVHGELQESGWVSAGQRLQLFSHATTATGNLFITRMKPSSGH